VLESSILSSGNLVVKQLRVNQVPSLKSVIFFVVYKLKMIEFIQELLMVLSIFGEEIQFQRVKRCTQAQLMLYVFMRVF
jgi:hypothetical protein